MSVETYKPSEMAAEVLSISSFSAELDEGKVVRNGSLVAQETQTITENGTYDTTLVKQLVANIPSEIPTLISKTITENGTYDPTDDNADGYNEVIVNVSGGSSDGSFIDPKHIDISTDSEFGTAITGYGFMNAPAAFGGNQKKNWWGCANKGQHWLKVTFEEAELIDKIEFSNGWSSGSSRWQSATVVFQGSNDDSTWVDLLTLTNLTASETPEIYNVNNNTKYLYYRFVCTSGTDSYTGIGKIRLYGKGEGEGSAKNILSGTDAPTSADGADGDIYLQVQSAGDSGLGWYAKPEYLVKDTTTNLWNGMVKTNTVASIAVRYHYSSWYGPIQISTDPDGVKHTSNTGNPAGSATIDGLTWYISTDTNWSANRGTTEVPDHVDTVRATGENIEPVIRRILEEAGMTTESTSDTIVVIATYCKVNGTWQELIGTDIDDVNTGE